MRTRTSGPSKIQAIADLASCLNLAIAAGGDTNGYGDGMIPLRHIGEHPIVQDMEDGLYVTWEPASERMKAKRSDEYGKILGHVNIVKDTWLNSRMCPVRKAVVAVPEKVEDAFTPGPWIVDEDEGVLYPRVHISRKIGELRDPMFEIGRASDPEAQANAKLIAAAPDLLDACRSLIAALEQVAKDHPDDLYLGSEYQRAIEAMNQAAGR